eukprot:1945246-Rhodomonas_salina.1
MLFYGRLKNLQGPELETGHPLKTACVPLTSCTWYQQPHPQRSPTAVLLPRSPNGCLPVQCYASAGTESRLTRDRCCVRAGCRTRADLLRGHEAAAFCGDCADWKAPVLLPRRALDRPRPCVAPHAVASGD